MNDADVLEKLYPFNNWTGSGSMRNALFTYMIEHYDTPDYVLFEGLKQIKPDLKHIFTYTSLIRYHSAKDEVMIRMFKHFDNFLLNASNHRIYFARTVPDFLKIKALWYAYDDNVSRMLRMIRGPKESNKDIVKEILSIRAQFRNDKADRGVSELFESDILSSYSNYHSINRALIASTQYESDELTELILNDSEVLVQRVLADSVFANAEQLDSLSKNNDYFVRYLVAIHKNTNATTLNNLLNELVIKVKNEDDCRLMSVILENSLIDSTKMFETFYQVHNFLKNDNIGNKALFKIACGVALNPNLSYEMIEDLVSLSSKSFELSFNLMANEAIPNIYKNFVIGSLQDALSSDNLTEAGLFSQTFMNRL